MTAIIDIYAREILDSELARQASDHLPVWADLAVDAHEEAPRGIPAPRITSRVPDSDNATRPD